LQNFQAKRENFANFLQIFAKIDIYRFVQLQNFCRNFTKILQNCKNLNQKTTIFVLESVPAFASFAKFFAKPRFDEYIKFCKIFAIFLISQYFFSSSNLRNGQ
jgi:preprotein translocase subunit Sss1